MEEKGLKTLNTIAGGDKRYMYNVEGGFTNLDDAIDQISETLEKRACTTCATDDYFIRLQAAHEALGFKEEEGSGSVGENGSYSKFIESMFRSNSTETTTASLLSID